LTRHDAGEIVGGPPVSEEREHPKLGLALSGGGHRAAFFHIGVLAKLAELGLLRPVQVISTVSGGSIIGALYYLHVKNVLESKTDAEIVDADYVKVVRPVVEEYREAAASQRMRLRLGEPARELHESSEFGQGSLAPWPVDYGRSECLAGCDRPH
jgi:predicted acylesterase/phospholipase RssA